MTRYEIFKNKKPPKYIYVPEFQGKPLEIPFEDLRKNFDLISESRTIHPIRSAGCGHIIEYVPLSHY
jgi:hypothetical protein